MKLIALILLSILLIYKIKNRVCFINFILCFYLGLSEIKIVCPSYKIIIQTLFTNVYIHNIQPP